MTNFPLPLPGTDSVREEQPAVDLGGVVLRYRCADAVAPFAQPVIERYRQYRASGEPLDGLRTMVGFTMWRLRQSGPQEYWLTAADYSAEDIVETTTDDLTFALWIDASQDDVTSRADVMSTEADMAAGLMFTKAALTVVDKGRPDELVLERRTPTGHDDSGWLVRTAEKSILRNKQVEVIAGVMAGTAPYLLPHLTLPTGSLVRVAEGRCLGIWSDAGALLVDGEGNGAGSSPAGSPAAPVREVLTETVDGVTLQTRIDPALAPLAQGMLAAFAEGGAGPLQPGAQMQSSYATFGGSSKLTGQVDRARVVDVRGP